MLASIYIKHELFYSICLRVRACCSETQTSSYIKEGWAPSAAGPNAWYVVDAVVDGPRRHRRTSTVITTPAAMEQRATAPTIAGMSHSGVTGEQVPVALVQVDRLFHSAPL